MPHVRTDHESIAMQKIIRKIIKLALFALLVLTALCFIAAWYANVQLGPDRAIARIGGYRLLARQPTPAPHDKVFYESFKTFNTLSEQDIEILEQCSDETNECMGRIFASLNWQIRKNEDFETIHRKLIKFSNAPTGFDDGCPAKYEITRLALAAQIAKHKKHEQQSDREKVFIGHAKTPIFSSSTHFRLYSQACKALFQKRPYLAHAYVYAVGTLAANSLWVSRHDWEEILGFPYIKTFTHREPF